LFKRAGTARSTSTGQKDKADSCVQKLLDYGTDPFSAIDRPEGDLITLTPTKPF